MEIRRTHEKHALTHPSSHLYRTNRLPVTTESAVKAVVEEALERNRGNLSDTKPARMIPMGPW